jgi:polynucleotide 5'-hydroxyl-kinase GRC3/NOL9
LLLRSNRPIEEELFVIKCDINLMYSIANVRMIKGPAIVAVNGACHVLGNDVSGRKITIRAGKALPFEPYGKCRLDVRFGSGGRMWRANPAAAGTFIWRDTARDISALADGKRVTVMLAGNSDTGKSTLSVYLANMVLGDGLVPCIIDGDIGQGDLAPPASIGATALSRPIIDLRDVSAGMIEFVGNTSPVGFERVVARKLRSILKRVGLLGDICIVNTDGYALGAGVKYKLMIANELQPDAIVCVGENSLLLDALGDGPWRVLRAKPTNQAPKSRSERANRRLEQFLRHIGEGSTSAELLQVKFTYKSRLFSPSELFRPDIKQLEPEKMKRMFVGLGLNKRVTGFGIVTGINKDSIRIQTKVETFDRVYLSNIRLVGNMTAEIRID